MKIQDDKTTRENLIQAIRDETGFGDDYCKPQSDTDLLLILIEDLYEKIEEAKDHSHTLS